jgi:ABC-2 type transport system ATP-binding protein
VIRVENLTKRYGDFAAVDNVAFNVKSGEFFGFIGPNGAGKTTTINMLCTLIPPTAGSASVAGFDITREPASVRDHIGVVFQDPTLDSRLSAKENLEFHAAVYHVPKSERRGRIDKVLALVELSAAAEELVANLSGGMKRRLEVARGLLHKPTVLFLDEPTLGLDPQTRSRIWEYLRDSASQAGMSVFLTTHYLEEAENCDRVAVIDNGRIIALDTPDNLKNAIGGDMVHLRASDEPRVRQELRKRYDIETKTLNGELIFVRKNAEEFLPELSAELRPWLKSIGVRRPTLDDVFLHLTGREIRDGDMGPSKGSGRITARVKGGI